MTPPPSRRTPYSLLVLFFVLATAIAALAYRYHLAQKAAVVREVHNQLVAIADTKVKHIAAWRDSKLGEARVVINNPVLLDAMERLIARRSSAAEQAQLIEWVDALLRELRYAGVSITDPAGNVVVRRGRVFGDAGHIRSLAAATAASADAALTDFHLDDGLAPVHLGLNIPLRRSPNAPSFGALLVGLDPEDELFPLLLRWPAPSKTAESLLVRRDGGDAVFLSPLRKRPRPAPTLHVPSTRNNVAAVRALAGTEGAFEAEDYRGDAVFAAAVRVPGAPWRLIAKIDVEEVLAPLRSESRLMGAFAISLIVGAAAVVFAIWRRNEVRSYRARYESELQRREAAERYEAERKAMNEELRRAMLAVQASESRLRAAFEQAAVGMNEVSLDGRFLRVNQRFSEITGYTAEELLQLTYNNLTHPEDRQFDRENFEAAMGGHTPARRWRKRYVRKDGATIWVAITASLLRDAAGQPLYSLGVVEDVTAAVAAQEQLRLTEERFRQLVENAPEGIAVITDETIRYVNPAAVRMFGAASAAEIVGGFAIDRVHPDDRGAARERMAVASTANSVPLAEHTFLKLNGESFPVEVSATPIGYDGQPSALMFFRDITERRRAEEDRARLEQRLRDAQKMETVGRLAGGVAHDFNNHLTVINGYCDMLLDALGPDDPLRDELGEIRAAGDRAAGLTQQLLAFSRKQVVDRRPIVLNEVVEEFCRMVRRLIGADIEVVTELEPVAGAVLADRGQLHQVLMNFVLNARDAMPDGGTIVIGTANVELAETGAPDQKPGRYVVLTVSDTGTGMPPETVQKIFEPFFTTKPMGIGTGLGLATVYGIVEQSGGFIRVASEPGRGTTFRTYLPRITGDPVAQPVEPPEARNLRGAETVLVVEDQSEVRKLATGILKKHGYRVFEAAAGPEAVDLARACNDPIDLLLTDVVMPGMTGRELAQRIVELRPGIRVLYMSGYSGDVLARDGVAAYLRKPFAPAELALKVREVLGNGS